MSKCLSLPRRTVTKSFGLRPRHRSFLHIREAVKCPTHDPWNFWRRFWPQLPNRHEGHSFTVSHHHAMISNIGKTGPIMTKWHKYRIIIKPRNADLSKISRSLPPALGPFRDVYWHSISRKLYRQIKGQFSSIINDHKSRTKRVHVCLKPLKPNRGQI